MRYASFWNAFLFSFVFAHLSYFWCVCEWKIDSRPSWGKRVKWQKSVVQRQQLTPNRDSLFNQRQSYYTSPVLCHESQTILLICQLEKQTSIHGLGFLSFSTVHIIQLFHRIYFPDVFCQCNLGKAVIRHHVSVYNYQYSLQKIVGGSYCWRIR